MEEMLSQEEIDELLRRIQYETLKASIIQIKPSEINNIMDNNERKMMLDKFNVVNELYVVPLERVFNYIIRNSDVIVSYDITNLSILERIKLFEQMLLRSGYTSSQIIELVPQSEEEINIITSAKDNGYLDNKILNNKSRLSAAKDYLKCVKNIDNSTLIKKNYSKSK